MKFFSKLRNPQAYLDYQRIFQEDKYVIVNNFFHSDFLNSLITIMSDRQDYYIPSTHNLGLDDTFKFTPLDRKSEILLNDEKFLHEVRMFTGISSITHAKPRFYRIKSGAEHFLSWHNDDGEPNRVLACRIELSTSFYKGGEFEIREIGKKEPFVSIGQLKFSQAVFFPVETNKFEHQVKPLTEGERYSFLIWFYEGARL